jgi:hypothetical protein
MNSASAQPENHFRVRVTGSQVLQLRGEMLLLLNEELSMALTVN